MSKLKREFTDMTGDQRKVFISTVLKTVKPQQCYDDCECDAECEERLYITRHEEYSIMECLKCGKIQVVYR